jgi:conjugative relaxase-like TrwC/TraI family protein
LESVLSIGKLATGQANYYLRLADGRVDRATSVASGVEDYYAGEDSAGEWLGGGTLRLSLKGKVEGTALHTVLAGNRPETGEPLRDTHGTRVPGFDLTFSAPKSVSILFGIGDGAVSEAVRRAHDAAVRDAIGYVERATSQARRGHGGQQVIAGRGLVAAAFRHRTSRLGDPQLHTHVPVANLVEGADGRWSALDGRLLYAHAETAGYLYEARLRAELTARLGVEWTPVHNGVADIRGVSPAVMRAFSRRRAEIEAELERRGESSAAAAQVATLATRRAKDANIDAGELVSEWRKRAASLGLDDGTIRTALNRVAACKPDPERLLAIADALAAPGGLTSRVSSFNSLLVARDDDLRRLPTRRLGG